MDETHLSADDVRNVRFGSSWRGYDLGEVDRFLEQVIETLRRYEEVMEVVDPGGKHLKSAGSK